MSRVEKPTGAMGYTFDATAHGTLASALSLGMGSQPSASAGKCEL